MMKINILIAALMLLGCSEKNEQPNIVEYKTFEVVANADPNNSASRTTLSGTILSWKPGDQMGVFVDGIQSNRLFTNTESNSFSGSFVIKNQTTSDVDCSAYYPYIPQGIGSSPIIKTSLSTKQVAPFDGSANFMTSVQQKINYTESSTMPPINFRFDNQLFSIVKVTFKNTNQDLQNEKFIGVTLTAPDNVVLTGAFSFDMATSIPVATFMSDKNQLSNKVSVDYAIENAPILGLNTEHVVYAIVKSSSVAITELKLNVKTENKVVTVNTTSPVTFTRGGVVTLPLLEITASQTIVNRVRTLAYWGDSITNGDVTESLSEELGSNWVVIPGGISSDPPLSIAGRQGGIPLCLGASITIPANTIDMVDVEVYSTNNPANESVASPVYFIWYDQPSYGYYSNLNPCIINGIECEITSVNNDYGSKGKLRRLKSGVAVDVPTGSIIESHGSREYKDADVLIIYIGANRQYEGNQNLLEFHKAMINHTTLENRKFIVIGFHFDPEGEDTAGYPEWTFWSPEYRDLFQKEFGNKYIDMKTIVNERAHELLVRTGRYAEGQEFSAKDLKDVNLGYWPESFNRDLKHPNESGAHALTIVIRERMEELGYLDY